MLKETYDVYSDDDGAVVLDYGEACKIDYRFDRE